MSEFTALAEIAMTNDLRHLDTISHNIANSATTAYKRDIPVMNAFGQSLINAGLSGSGDPDSDATPGLIRGIDMSMGTSLQTGNPLDITLGAKGFLEVRKDDHVYYTKNGSLNIDANGGLVTGAGLTVMGESGDIRLTTNTPRIDKQGRIYDDEIEIGALNVVSFDDITSLRKVTGELFESDSIPVKLDSEEDINIRQAYLEDSNVNPLTEMTQLIATVRHFQATQKILTGYDQAIGEAIHTIAEF